PPPNRGRLDDRCHGAARRDRPQRSSTPTFRSNACRSPTIPAERTARSADHNLVRVLLPPCPLRIFRLPAPRFARGRNERLGTGDASRWAATRDHLERGQAMFKSFALAAVLVAAGVSAASAQQTDPTQGRTDQSKQQAPAISQADRK